MSAVLVQALEERGEGAIARDERRIDGFDRLHHLQRLTGDAFAGGCSCENEALEVGVIAFAGHAITEIELRQTGAGSCERCHKELGKACVAAARAGREGSGNRRCADRLDLGRPAKTQGQQEEVEFSSYYLIGFS